MMPVRWRQLVWAVVLLAYALLVHYSNLGRTPPMLGAALALAPPLLVRITGLWRPAAVPLLLLGGGLLLWRSWPLPLIERHFDWLYLGQQCALYAALALAFGHTLLPGQIPLCSRGAAQLRGPLDFETLRYTRALARLWTAFLALIAVVILLLYLFVRRSIWSLSVNFLILPAVVLLFAAELLWRRRALPHAPQPTLRQMARLLR